MPHAPEKNDQDDPFEVPPIKRDARPHQKHRRENESPAKALEQRAVAIRADHSRQVMPHRAERGHEHVNVLRAPTRLRQSKNRHEQQRRADIQNQVAPTVQDPEVPFRHTHWHRRYSLGTGKRADVLHRTRAHRLPQLRQKINVARNRWGDALLSRLTLARIRRLPFDKFRAG